MAHSYDREKLIRLIQKYLAGKASQEEQQFLEAYYNVFDKDPDLLDTVDLQEKQALSNEMKAAIMQRTGQQPAAASFMKRTTVRMMAAAAIILTIAIPVYYFTTRKTINTTRVTTIPKPSPAKDILPGGNKATLTLADGSVIVLDSAQNGMLTDQGHARVVKKDGELKYEPATGGRQSAVENNTVTTPTGGQYHIVLSDGTGVWLNAASSIRFPAAFSGKERLVELSGEAYFEVTKNQHQPFRVITGRGAEIQVLGTSFNVNAYADESAMKTTLLEGKVKVADQVLRPGEQALFTQDARLTIHEVDTEEAIAWKNGLFWFDNVDIQSIMRQLERWYKVQVEYKGNIPTRRFAGQVSRNTSLMQVLKILELSKVHFILEGNKVTVMP